MSWHAGFVWRSTGLCEAGRLGQDVSHARTCIRSSALARGAERRCERKLIHGTNAVQVLLAAGTVREGGV